MGKCTTKIESILFDFTDDQITEVTIKQDFWGDCPLGVKRVYKKIFPARMSIVDILEDKDGIKNYLLWS